MALLFPFFLCLVPSFSGVIDCFELCIERQVVWLSDSDRAKGYAVDFISLSLHAVSRDPEAYPSPCIYAQVIDP